MLPYFCLLYTLSPLHVISYYENMFGKHSAFLGKDYLKRVARITGGGERGAERRHGLGEQ